MYISKESLIINDINMGEYITNVKYGFHDTWSDDTGYTLSNKFTGTFKGTFPKITIKLAKGLTPKQITMLTNKIFRTKFQKITYDDPDGTRKTITTHKGDLEFTFTGIRKHESFTYSFVGNEALE